MADTLRDALLKSGAVVDGASALPLHFGAPRAELHATLNACTVADRSPLARLIGNGPDLLDLIHRLSTNAVADLKPGEGAETVLTTAKGRIVERLFLSHLGDAGVLLVGGVGRADAVLEHLKRFTFAEQTGLADRGEDHCLLALSGPLAGETLTTAGFEAPEALGVVVGSHDGLPVYVLGHDGYSPAGRSILVTRERAGSLWRALVLAVSKTDGRAAGEWALQAARVRHGVPLAGTELTEDHNPLEAGLRRAVAFDKGCYVGQEVVARLDTYDKVSRRIVGLTFPADTLVVPGESKLFRDGDAAGTVTSVAAIDGMETAALAYVKKRVAAIGDTVQIGSADGPTATLCDFPMTP